MNKSVHECVSVHVMIRQVGGIVCYASISLTMFSLVLNTSTMDIY